MSEKVRLKISPVVARFVAPGLAGEVKLQGVGSAADMAVNDRVTLLCCLMRDGDDVVRQAAESAFSALPHGVLLEYLALPAMQPLMLDSIARFHHAVPEITGTLLGCEALSPQARQFLQRLVAIAAAARDQASQEHSGCPDGSDDANADAEELPVVEDMDEPEQEPEEDVCEENEEYLSKYKMAQMMGIAEKIKMALTGDKEWRAILVKDANKLVSGSVIKNPRITEAEIVTILKAGVQNDEIVRLICANKEWIKNYKIRKALVDNPKTPLPNALRYLTTLPEKDIAGYAKSKNISSVIATQAKRLLLNKKK